jgi:hypothetical protein
VTGFDADDNATIDGVPGSCVRGHPSKCQPTIRIGVHTVEVGGARRRLEVVVPSVAMELHDLPEASSAPSLSLVVLTLGPLDTNWGRNR